MWPRLLLAETVRLTALGAVLTAAILPSDAAAQLSLPEAGGVEGQSPNADDTEGLRPRDPQLLTSAEMKSLSTKYAFEISSSVAKVQAVRRNAQDARDAIKVSCIDQLLPEMKVISDVLTGRFVSIARRADEFAVRAEFVVISPGYQRIVELRQQAEECIGDTLDSQRVDSNKNDIPPSSGTDPSEPANKPPIAERPVEASRFR